MLAAIGVALYSTPIKTKSHKKDMKQLQGPVPVWAYSSCTTAKFVYCLLPFLCSMTLVGMPMRPEVLAPAPASILEA